jgi:DinB family protein
MNAADFPRVGLPEAIERLASMPAFVQAALDAASHDELVFRPGESGEFSLVEHACHLRDLEREGYLTRVRRVLAEDLPTLDPFEGDRVARERNYLDQDAHAAARAFAAARRETVALLAPLTGAELQREAMFAGKRITLLEVIAMIVDHDRGHREEMESLAEALESP